jgi:glutaredoxin 3
MLGTLLKRVTVRTLDAVVARGRESSSQALRVAASGLDRLRGVVGLDRVDVRLDIPAWDGAQPDQPMWQSDREKLHKHRVDRGIVKPQGAAAAAKAEPPLKLYFKRGCPYSRAALELLRERDIAAAQVDYTDDHDLRRAIRGQTGRKTSPHVFIHGKCIGGYDELRELDQAGTLKDLLAGKQPAPAAAKATSDEPDDDDSDDEISAASLRSRVAEGACSSSTSASPASAPAA